MRITWRPFTSTSCKAVAEAAPCGVHGHGWLVVAVGLGFFAPRVEKALSGAGWEASGSQSVQARKVIERSFAFGSLVAAGLSLMLTMIGLLFFAMIFAISMDYTMFLLSSAKEHWDRTQDAREAMVGGVAHRPDPSAAASRPAPGDGSASVVPAVLGATGTPGDPLRALLIGVAAGAANPSPIPQVQGIITVGGFYEMDEMAGRTDHLHPRACHPRRVDGAEETPRPSGHDRESLRGRLPELAFGVGGMLATAGIVALVPDLRHAFSLALHGDLQGLHEQFHQLGTGGVILLLALILAHAVLLYPTEIVTATAGFVYGFLPGLALVTVGWLASALLAYLLGRALGRPFVHVVFGGRRFASLERAVARGGSSLLLVVRLIPVVPFSLTGYVAGAVRVPLWRFGWTTVIGYLPLTVLIAYLGSQAESLSLSDPRLWIGVGVLVGLLLAARFVNLERTR